MGSDWPKRDVMVDNNFASPSDIAMLLRAFNAATSESDMAGNPRGHVRRMHVTHKTEYRTEVFCRKLRNVCELATVEQVTKIRDRIVTAICQHFPTATPQYPEFTILSEMREGDCTPLHADAEKETPAGWEPNHCPWRTVVGLLYLNTSGIDYQGGILRLPEVGVTVSPEAGMIVAFPSGRRHVHEVTKVTDGKRLSMAVWLTGDERHHEGQTRGAPSIRVRPANPR